MKQIKITENLIQLRRLIVFNCFFVEEVDGFTLIDTGLPGSGQAIYRAAQALGKPIRRVTVTHAHADHAGSLDTLASLLPDTEFIYPARVAAFMRGEQALLPEEPQAKPQGGFQQVAKKADRTVEPGEMIGSLQVVASPGHTPAHTAFFDTRDNTLIAGDALQTQGGVGVAGQIRPLFPLPAFATWHKPIAIQTAKKLLDLKPSRLAVGHGPVIEHPMDKMRQAIGRG